MTELVKELEAAAKALEGWDVGALFQKAHDALRSADSRFGQQASFIAVLQRKIDQQAETVRTAREALQAQEEANEAAQDRSGAAGGYERWQKAEDRATALRRAALTGAGEK